MTHPMLERVAAAMANSAAEKGILLNEWISIDVARAAIQALLEPDEGMVEDGDAMVSDGTYGSRSILQAMLLPLVESVSDSP